MKTGMNTKARRTDEARKKFASIKSKEFSRLLFMLKFAKAVEAMRLLTDAMEEISEQLVAAEKFERIALRKNGARGATRPT